MEDEIKDLEDLKKELPAQKVIEEINILFLDVSSTCVGYAINSINFSNKKAKLTKAGCLWFNPDWSHAEKYHYIFTAIVQYFWIVEAIDYIVVEQYSINPKKMVGINVIPEMMGSIKVAAQENGLKVSSILPQSWRSVLKIKPIVTFDKNGKRKRDFKEPAKNYVNNLFQVPEQVVSNITHNKRQTPSDLFDAICIALAWTERLGFIKIDTSSVVINGHIGTNLGN